MFAATTTSPPNPAFTPLKCLRRPSTLLAILGAFLFAGSTVATAAELTGKTLRMTGKIDATNYRGTSETKDFPLEVYFGTAGTRFVTMLGWSGDVRVVIEPGKDKGLKRRKDGNFVYEVKLQQSGSSVTISILGRGKDDHFVNDSWIFAASYGAGSCRIDQFRYIADPEGPLRKVKSRAGACTLSDGPPEGISD